MRKRPLPTPAQLPLLICENGHGWRTVFPASFSGTPCKECGKPLTRHTERAEALSVPSFHHSASTGASRIAGVEPANLEPIIDHLGDAASVASTHSGERQPATAGASPTILAAVEEERDRLRGALEDIAVGRWNLGRGKLITVHEFARRALGKDHP